ncbi:MULTISPECIES: hypothetical protein [Xanthomonas]|uniref:Uncharacterized protein n=2 Tax=Xanthomonas citri TaxID=346 RepID=A0AB33CM10_XANCI|nr:MULTISPECIES: hypothetical protein [Xanthomonas]MBV6780938.1 hypothetical protein [Xanthomonas campestris pv. trichodesmae]ASK91856.1 hypothetical protein XcvCFBP7111P_10360 [Xanthomonas citri pv. vignicola]MBV6788462.1 hypothetical protein [Xanthomonas campestris pv. clerodendri]MBZ3919222.1 hypothetical protein [Xanthomonas campestris pv. trichodesmae]MBZ3922897.1 hypothetical protein [Xanthomonas citri pv. sesbaniae]
MNKRQYTLQVRVAWWWTYLYTPAVVLMICCGLIPSQRRIEADAVRAIRIVLKPARRHEVAL